MVLVVLQKGSSSKSYNPIMGLIYLGDTHNFIFKTMADLLSLKAAKAERNMNKAKIPPPIATVNGKPLRTTTIVCHIVRMFLNADMKQSHSLNFIVVNIAYYNMIPGMAWLQKQNPDIQRDAGIWHKLTSTD